MQPPLARLAPHAHVRIHRRRDKPACFRRLTLGAAVASAFMVAFAPAPASAATRTWSGTSVFGANWGAGFQGSFLNWVGALPTNGDNLVFAGTNQLTNHNDLLQSIGDLDFAANAGAFTLEGNGLTVLGALRNLGNNVQTINLPLTVGVTGKTWNGGSGGLGINGGLSLGNNALTLENGIAINHAGAAFLVGEDGPAALILRSNSSITSFQGILGQNGAGNGSVTLDGGQTRWTNTNNLSVGQGGTGALNIRNGGKVSNVYGFVGANSGSQGMVTVDGVGSEWSNTGHFSFSTGVGMAVGYGGTGVLNILNGGQVNGGYSYLGYGTGASGTALVDGVDSLWTVRGDLTTGGSGSGSLTLQNGGKVSTQIHVHLGLRAGGQGTLTVSGAGSALETNVSSGSNVYVGSAGQGELLLLNGGKVSNRSGFVGFDTGGVGVATVDGVGSQWSNQGSLNIGYFNANGTLQIRNGGQVDNGAGYLGYTAGSSGTAVVDGAGSTWSNASLTVGNIGNGTLEIRNGGLVRNVNSNIGSSAGSTGLVTVDGEGSVWQNTGTLIVSVGGKGTLLIRNAGQVTAAKLVLGSLGDIRLEGGILQLADSSTTAGGRFYWTGGTLQYTGDASLGTGLVGLEDVLNLGPGKTLQVDGALTIGAGRALFLGGGQVKSKSLVLAGSILSTGSVDLSNLGNLTGHGLVAGRVTGGSDTGITADGTLTLGDGAVNGGYDFAGGLDVGGHQVILLSADAARLGASTLLDEGGRLSAVNGATLAQGQTLTFQGNARIDGDFIHNGLISGSGGALTFTDDVGGPGSFAGDIVFKGGYNPGNSPATASFNGGDATFDGSSVLTMEILGTLPGDQYDQLVDIGVLTFNGRLRLLFADDYQPEKGDSFRLFAFDSFVGSLAEDRIEVIGFDRAKLDFSHLVQDGTLNVVAVPEPETYALMLAGLGLLAWRIRRQ